MTSVKKRFLNKQSMTLLQAEHIKKTYEGHVALDDVSITVPHASIVGLLGPNGAGKTSLIRIINQIVLPDAGQVLFDGQPMERHHLEQMGYLPEERGLYKKMQVEEHLFYLARLKGVPSKEAKVRIKHWLERFDLMKWRKKKVEELSKGMQQKVQFIATVLHRPRLVILDEPFSGFDPVNAEIVKEEILELNRQGTTIMLSTHRMESVEELCRHVVMLHASRKVLDGTTREIRRRFKEHVFEVHMPVVIEQLPEGFQLLEKKQADDGLWEYRIQGAEHLQPNDLLQFLIDKGQVIHFEEVLPSMKDIFIKLVS
jgi:ABC-2 type transport system ATP-binding protein